MLEKKYPGERDRSQIKEIIKVKRETTAIGKVIQAITPSRGCSPLHVRGQSGGRNIWDSAQGQGQTHIVDRSYQAGLSRQKVQKPIIINPQNPKPPQHPQNEGLFLHLLRRQVIS